MNHFALFMLGNQRYGLRLNVIDRIVQLPSLAALPSAPAHLAGIFDLNGTMVPVVDLNTLFKQPVERQVMDKVIVLRGGRPFGIIANQVLDICQISASDTASHSDAGSRSVIEGAARVQNEIVLLLDFAKLEELADLHTAGHAASTGTSRAGKSGGEDRAGTPEFVVVGLGGEYLGLPLKSVREFCESRNITPIPCCPSHIAGTMNLRGEILAVMDPRPILKMPAAETPGKKVVVLDEGGMTLGIRIDEIYDVIPMDPGQLSRLPLTAESNSSEYLAGTALWGRHVLTILDCPKLLASTELVVNDEV